MGFFPLVLTITTNGGANLVSTNMVDQLQAISLIVTDVGNTDDCEYLSESIFAWGAGVTSGHNADDHSPYLLYLWIEPRRCPAKLTDDELATNALCYAARGLDPGELTQTEQNFVNALCVTWGDAQRNISNEELASRADIRTGAIQAVSVSTIANLTLEDGVTVEETIYAVEAKYNQSITIYTA